MVVIKKNSRDKSLKEAKNTAYRLLKIRNRSQQEIRDKLTQKDFPKEIVEETISYLESIDLIDDNLFAKGFIRSRLNKPFGKRRIVLELKQKGVAPDIIENEFLLIADEINETDAAITLAKKRATKYSGIDKIKKQQRLFAYLIRRGFSGESAQKAIKTI